MTMVSLGERRHHPRQRLGRLATIKLGVGIEPRYVLVTNVSAEGVRLQLNGIEPFDEFVLLFHGNGAARTAPTELFGGRFKTSAPSL